MNSILEINNMCFGYNDELLLKDINFELESGDFCAMVGSNGAGKSTLLKLILGELTAKSGEINLKYNYNEIGYVPQLGFGKIFDFPITVGELVSLSLYSNLKGFKRIDKNNKIKIEDALSSVNLKGFFDKLYSKLSGGQRQRVLIAKSLVSQPKFMILDEPTNGIDHESRISLYKLLNHLNKNHNITILMITHELSDVELYTNKIYKLDEGTIVRYK